MIRVTVQEIEFAVTHLPEQDLDEFRVWVEKSGRSYQTIRMALSHSALLGYVKENFAFRMISMPRCRNKFKRHLKGIEVMRFLRDTCIFLWFIN
jgi:hypothetical protein